MLRRLPIIIVSGALLIAAFSTGAPFLFFLVYLGILVIGGAYVVTRFGLADLEAGYALDRVTAAVGETLRVTYTVRNAEPPAQAVAGGPQPDDAAGAAAGPRPGPGPARRARLGGPRAALRAAATSGSIRWSSAPAIRSASSRPRPRSARAPR